VIHNLPEQSRGVRKELVEIELEEKTRAPHGHIFRHCCRRRRSIRTKRGGSAGRP